jgi:tRNA (guanine37-N1)-methyltransferase
MRINIITIFPDFFREALALGIPGRAARAGLVTYKAVDLRDFTHDKHRTVDDEPYGGGAGMVMKPEPFFEAADTLKPEGPIVLLDARGRVFRHEDAVRLSTQPEMTLLCGHYKDVDWRVAEGLATDVFSLGDFVLSGGEPAALCLVDSVVRLLPGSLGDHESASSDSFYDAALLAPPGYTRPPEYRGMAVPEVLRSGDHAAIAEWRRRASERLTRQQRPDLWEAEEPE